MGRLPAYEEGDRREELKPADERTAAEAEEVSYLKSRSPLFQARQVRCPCAVQVPATRAAWWKKASRSRRR
jgi:hypothetical protein